MVVGIAGHEVEDDLLGGEPVDRCGGGVQEGLLHRPRRTVADRVVQVGLREVQVVALTCLQHVLVRRRPQTRPGVRRGATADGSLLEHQHPQAVLRRAQGTDQATRPRTGDHHVVADDLVHATLVSSVCAPSLYEPLQASKRLVAHSCNVFSWPTRPFPWWSG